MITTPHAALEALIAWATPEARKPDVLAARAAYFQRTGEVFDDDRQLEQRMSAFLEHYVCDRTSPELKETPARARYQESLRTEGPETARAFRALTETVHSLFVVRELLPSLVVMEELFSQVRYRVTERRQLVGLAKGDVLEARVIPWHDEYFFAPASCWHPHDASPLIIAEVARRKASHDARSAIELVEDCAQRSLKVDRYRQISVEKIYDFDAEKRA